MKSLIFITGSPKNNEFRMALMIWWRLSIFFVSRCTFSLFFGY